MSRVDMLVMEDLFNVRSQFGNDFAFSTSNDFSTNETQKFSGKK